MSDERDASGETTIGLRALKKTKPAWYWLQQNFSLPAVLTIVGILAASAAWIFSLKTRVVVLEHDFKTVEHVITIMPDKAALATLQTQAGDHEKRITRLEEDLDYARRCPPHCDPPQHKTN